MTILRRALTGPWVPPEMGKQPYLWAFSLSFLLWQYFVELPGGLELVMLVLTIVGFLPLYFASFWTRDRAAVACVGLTCLLGVAWAPFNTGGCTFFVFAAGMCGRVTPRRNAHRLLALVILAATVAGCVLSPAPRLFLVAPWTIGLSVGIASIMDEGLRTSRQRLSRKQEEVEHLARIAEHERISRDLHDLLGHSLSLIVLKAELANKLADKVTGKLANDPLDPSGPGALEACKREIGDIEATARRALSEVRTAVTGYRDSGLAGALASARASLAAANVHLHEEVQQFALAPAAEHVLALALREAVTNVVRHAGATRCTLGLAREQGNAILRVDDDGRRLRNVADVRAGNGLTGMLERATSLGGQLSIDVNAGLRLELRVPIEEST